PPDASLEQGLTAKTLRRIAPVRRLPRGGRNVPPLGYGGTPPTDGPDCATRNGRGTGRQGGRHEYHRTEGILDPHHGGRPRLPGGPGRDHGPGGLPDA